MFTQVVEEGGFTQASKKTGIPKSTLSEKVSELEKKLGLTLLIRTTRRLRVTDAGNTYYLKNVGCLQELMSANEEVSRKNGLAHGYLRISAPRGMAGSALPDQVCRFMRDFPEVSVEMLFSDRRVDLLTEGIDVAIRLGDLNDSTLVSRKIGKTKYILVAAPAYLKSVGVPGNPKELGGLSCLLFKSCNREDWLLETEGGQSQKVSVKGRVRADSIEAVLRIASAGEGVALLPETACRDALKAGNVVRVLPKWATKPEAIHLLFASQSYVAPKIRAVIPYLELALK
jgi:DNA-binding transcriptional LysR family regulator